MKLNLNISDLSCGGDSTQSTARNTLRCKFEKQVLEKCIFSLDVFKDLLEGIPHMKGRVIRDVSKTMATLEFNQGDIVYDLGEKATGVYFCLQGSVSMSIVNQTPDEPNPEEEQQTEPQYLEINEINEGEGFGEAEFISESRRRMRASVSKDKTILGVLQLEEYSEVIENYKLRVYYKKRNSFLSCPLFRNLEPRNLDFIINNTKTVTISISHELVREGDPAHFLYLVNKGNLQSWKLRTPQPQSPSSYAQTHKYPKRIPPLHKFMTSLLEEGCFIGDLELAMDKCYQSTVIALTEKVELYYCDNRLIRSQLSQQQINAVSEHYAGKQDYVSQNIRKFDAVCDRLRLQKQKDLGSPLSVHQIEMRRKILHRYVQKKPSLVGCCSPHQIGEMIDRKKVRANLSLPSESLNPYLKIFKNHFSKKQNYQKASFSPIAVVRPPAKRAKTEISERKEQSPEDEDSLELMQIKPPKSMNLKAVRYQGQLNISATTRILGPYHRQGRLKNLSDIIKKIRFEHRK